MVVRIFVLMLIVQFGLPVSAAGADAACAREGAGVLVTGATGRMGRHLIDALDAQGFEVRGLTRDADRARQKFPRFEWVQGDIRDPDTLAPALEDICYVINAAGAIAPDGPNAPRFVDWEGARNVIDASVEAGIAHFVQVSSIGVTHRFHLLNLTFGDVLRYKAMAEEYLRESGLTYTIVRPGGLRAGPARTEGMRVSQGDPKGGSHIYLPDVARLIAEATANPDAYAKTFEVLSDRDLPVDGWKDVFATLEADE